MWQEAMIQDQRISDQKKKKIKDKLCKLKGKCLELSIPDDDKLRRAFYVYYQALLSIDYSAQIINYWRAIEAICGERDGKENSTEIKKKYFIKELLNQLKTIKLKNIYFDDEGKNKKLMPRYKRFILNHLSKLKKEHGSYDDIGKFLWDLRCDSAHAKREMKYLSKMSFFSLYNNAFFLKYLARCTIERIWKE